MLITFSAHPPSCPLLSPFTPTSTFTFFMVLIPVSFFGLFTGDVIAYQSPHTEENVSLPCQLLTADKSSGWGHMGQSAGRLNPVQVIQHLWVQEYSTQVPLRNQHSTPPQPPFHGAPIFFLPLWWCFWAVCNRVVNGGIDVPFAAQHSAVVYSQYFGRLSLQSLPTAAESSLTKTESITSLWA